MSDPDRLEYLHSEYVRITAEIDSLVRSSFEDFQLLGAIGVLLAWPPLATSDLFEGASDSVLLIGLLAILLIVAILGVRGLLKESIIRFQLEQARSVEADIRNELGPSEFDTFRRAEGWARWEERWHQPLLGHFLGLFLLALIGFPDFVLALEGELWQVAVYTGTFVLVAAVFASAVRKLRESTRGPMPGSK